MPKKSGSPIKLLVLDILKPHKPNIALIIGISIVFGLLVGVALLVGWDYTYKTVRTPQDLLPLGASNVLVELPMVLAEEAPSRFRFNAVYVRIAVLILLIGTVVAVDLFYMKVDVLLVKVFGLIQTKLALTGV